MVTPKKRPAGVLLTPRQAQILEHIARGDTQRSVAHALTISPATVAYHVGQLQMKLHTRSLPALIALTIVAGILSSDQFPLQLTGDLFVDGSLLPD